MVTCKETRAAIIALHKNGFTGKDIVATKIAPKSTIYRFIKNFKERGSILVKKASGRPRKSSKRQDRLLKRIQLRDRSATSAELAQEWQQAAQDEMAGAGVGISDELISLQITSANVPDLTLIDLPGIARVAVKGQPENIGDQIRYNRCLSTAGILTKPDLVDKGTEGTVVDIVHNEVIHLTKGYMIVRCRGQKEIIDQVTLNEATATENAFFQDHPQFSKLYEEGFATIPKLAEKLTIELVHHIQKSLPRLEEQIEAKLAETQKELEAYGNGPPSDPAERLSFLIDVSTALKSAQLLYQINMKIEKEVDNYEAKYRGRELPGFINYKTFEGLVREQIKLLEEPALKTLKTISDVVRKKFIQLAQCSFVGFPNLLKIAKTKIEAIKLDKESLAESMLRTQFKMELIVYSQDGTNSQSLQHTKNKVEEDYYDSEDDEGTTESFNCLSVGISTDNNATLREMRLHLESYYTIASKRLSDQIPMVIRYLLLQEAALELQRNMLQLLQDKDGVDDLLKEDFDIGQKRESLLSRQKRLMKARSLLVTY
ncbi:Interferon-induced GTP-binding protein MxA [Anabarilius grahami]|uniref:Interferon-induced GTP-binding protein MxA n=1 Tax=Anabarilius grahami TaxID=495550 RepID=A0A3N0XLD3_ANAGA|nr:Interferon-induced GTP-binding protein MxA [Anabarilius grahami]